MEKIKHYHFTDKDQMMHLNVRAHEYAEAAEWIKKEFKGEIKMNELFLIGISTNYEEYKKFNVCKTAGAK